MKRIAKILAIFLAVLMLATMATACKEEDDEEDFGTVDVGGKTGKNDSDSDDGDSGDIDSDIDSDNDSDSGKTNNGDSGKTNNGGSGKTNDGGSGKTNDGGSGKTNDGSGSQNDNITDEEKQKELVENYDSTKKYSADNNPLVAEAKKPNTGVEPSFDIDTTGFVKGGIKIADLKGKKLTMMTGIMYSCFNYRGEKGETIGEWKWFEMMKATYGLNLIYIKTDWNNAPEQITAYMNAGKTLDIYTTHNRPMPTYLALSQSIEPYINIQNAGNSPGVSEMTMKQARWGGTYRGISPIGVVNFLYYNKSMVEEFRLKDPHTLWREGKWNWDAWREFMHSIPAKNSSGEDLFTYWEDSLRAAYSWPETNGVEPIAIDTESKTPNMINNWKNEKVREAWNFYASVNKSVKCGGTWNDFWSGRVMVCGVYNLQNDFWDDEYCNTHRYDWVPYPAATTPTGRCCVNSYGFLMCIPKKVKAQANIPYSVKFAELWANRFTEAIFDYFATAPWLAFDYEHRKELFEFCVDNTYFGLGMDGYTMLSSDERAAVYVFLNSMSNSQYNVLSEATKVENLIEKAIKLCIEYGS